MPSTHCLSNTKFTRNVSGTSTVFFFFFFLINKEKGFPKHTRCQKFFNFFVDYSITDAKVFL